MRSPDNNLSQSISWSTSSAAFDVCGYCGAQFPNKPVPDWEARDAHLKGIHKFGECHYRTFFDEIQFREHLKYVHAAKIGKWTNKLEAIGRVDEPPPIPRDKNGQQSQGASLADTGMGASKMAPIKAHGNTKCPFCGEDNLHVEDSRRRHIERHMEEVAFAVVSKPYEEWDFYSDSTSKSLADVETEDIMQFP